MSYEEEDTCMSYEEEDHEDVDTYVRHAWSHWVSGDLCIVCVCVCVCVCVYENTHPPTHPPTHTHTHTHTHLARSATKETILCREMSFAGNLDTNSIGTTNRASVQEPRAGVDVENNLSSQILKNHIIRNRGNSPTIFFFEKSYY